MLSLSIIPAQKAAEAFSSAVLKLYARDRALLSVFALLVCTTMASILLGSGWSLGLITSQLVAAQFIFLGVSFDGLRLFYTKTLDLLIADTAVGLVVKECDRSIRRVQRTVNRLTRVLQMAGDPAIPQAVRQAMLFAEASSWGMSTDPSQRPEPRFVSRA